MSPENKAKYYRLLDLLEQAESQLAGLDLGPLEDLDGRELREETEALRWDLRSRVRRIREVIKQLESGSHA